ncbi:MAG: RHS repeat-associated core domain-containing protein [Candidatus Aminicenantes bacterium]|nr:RHS repeat-associated core domain-containing protein [Candidatus Aminicenantes bacterium]
MGTSGGPKMIRTLSASPVGNFYLYSFDGKLLQPYNVYGVLLKDYIYMGDRLIAEYDHVGSRYLYYTPDQINSTRVVTDNTGTVVYSVTYDPYGGVQIPDQYNTIDPLPKFSGKERDEESEFDYFGARYYAHMNYRWISVDPTTSKSGAIGDPQRWNLYSYCGNNPLTFLDPNGSDQINVFLAFRKSELRLDFNALQATAKANGHNVTVYERGTYTQADFEKSLDGKDTWTFYVGHSTAVNKETKKRSGILMPGRTVGDENLGKGWLTDWVISNNENVGIFACNSSDYAFDLFALANNVIATNNELEPYSTGLEAGAYYTLELLLQGSDPNYAMQMGTGWWAWVTFQGFTVEPPAIVSNTTKK